jgi:preprotein translocase subunit SecF
LFIGLLTGAYSSIFIASPVLADLKEREPRYIAIRQRLAARPAGTGAPLTPAAAAVAGAGALGASAGGRPARSRARTQTQDASSAAVPATDADEGLDEVGAEPAVVARTPGPARPRPAARTANRPPPRPRKKGRRR